MYEPSRRRPRGHCNAVPILGRWACTSEAMAVMMQVFGSLALVESISTTPVSFFRDARMSYCPCSLIFRSNHRYNPRLTWDRDS